MTWSFVKFLFLHWTLLFQWSKCFITNRGNPMWSIDSFKSILRKASLQLWSYKSSNKTLKQYAQSVSTTSIRKALKSVHLCQKWRQHVWTFTSAALLWTHSSIVLLKYGTQKDEVFQVLWSNSNSLLLLNCHYKPSRTPLAGWGKTWYKYFKYIHSGPPFSTSLHLFDSHRGKENWPLHRFSLKKPDQNTHSQPWDLPYKN